MRKVYGILVLILITATLSQISADEFETKSKYDPYSPLVQQIALELKKETDLETAKAIWEWMNQNIQYGKSHASGVDNIIRAGKGQCSQQAFVAASFLLAAGWKTEKVRIGEGTGHAWVEICTDRWHRFDTVYSHSFEHEYSLPIYTHENYVRIDYFYYDSRESPNITLIDSKTDLAQDIHIITLEIENSGGMRKYMKIEVMTDLEIVGSSHDFEILISPGETVTTKVFLRGEGKALIEIGEIRYETELIYDHSEDKQPQSNVTESRAKEEILTEPVQDKESVVSPKEKQPVEVKKITIPESTENVRTLRIDTRSSEHGNFTKKSFPFILIFLLPIAVISTVAYRKRIMN